MRDNGTEWSIKPKKGYDRRRRMTVEVFESGESIGEMAIEEAADYSGFCVSKVRKMILNRSIVRCQERGGHPISFIDSGFQEYYYSKTYKRGILPDPNDFYTEKKITSGKTIKFRSELAEIEYEARRRGMSYGQYMTHRFFHPEVT